MSDQGLSANALARRSGVNRQVIANVLNGTVWADTLTVIDLEGALGVILWPDHVQWRIPAAGEAPEGYSDEVEGTSASDSSASNNAG
ncbi:helix-turn-helix domain-containing protein [Streptomyces sp. NPDC088260]|uniref:helix-turn-helix domain-containing protein n=1 Tax=Streptomyces sp. NPDC088260 TaxID=3365850 RepID=UPI0037FBFD0A